MAIHGKIAYAMLSGYTTYVAYLVFRTTSNYEGLFVPAKTTVIYGGVIMETKNVYLQIQEASEICIGFAEIFDLDWIRCLSDNYGLPKSFGISFPHEDDVPRLDRGNGNHASLPPPPPTILPNPKVQRLEKFKVTQALLEMKHQDGRSVCSHVLEMKSDIDRLRVLGVVVSRKLAVDWVLQSLLELYSEFIKDYYMTDRDMTLIDLAYLLIAAKSTMIWRTCHANLIGRSTP
ncbi:hypothetical protein Lser_V15G06117 [Lactuca serriola]